MFEDIAARCNDICAIATISSTVAKRESVRRCARFAMDKMNAKHCLSVLARLLHDVDIRHAVDLLVSELHALTDSTVVYLK